MFRNVTYLIGNGFDIGLGLKTKYDQFWDWYKEQPPKNDIIKRFKEELDDSRKHWSDLEEALGQMTSKYSIEKSEDFFEGKDDLQKHLMEYLKEKQEELVYTDQDLSFFLLQMRWMRKTTTSLLRDQQWRKVRVSDKEIINFRFINFNYTATLNRILYRIQHNPKLLTNGQDEDGNTTSDQIVQVVNVHGAINKTPIIGVNDVGQIADEKFAESEAVNRYLIKHELDEMSDRGFEESAIDIIDSSNIICIYGMSLGITDNQWWDALVHWLLKSHDRYLVVFLHDNQYKGLDIEGNERIRNKIHESIKEKFLSKWHESEGYQYLYKHIFCVVNQDIFDMKYIKGLEELFEEAQEEFA